MAKVTLAQVLQSVRDETYQRQLFFTQEQQKLVLHKNWPEVGTAIKTIDLEIHATALIEYYAGQPRTLWGRAQQVISPVVILDNKTIQAYINIIQALMPEGGVWVFATILQESFSQLQLGGGQAFPLQEMQSLIQYCSGPGLSKPVIEHVRYTLRYMHWEDALHDYNRLSGQDDPQGAISRQQGAVNCTLAVAFGCVQIQPQVRTSMRPIN